MTVEERLERVEREQAETKVELARAKRRVRGLVVAGAVGLACLVVLLAGWAGMPEALAQAQARVAPEVRAQKFVLVETSGKERATLSVAKDGPILSLFDEKGKPRAMLSVAKDGPILSLFDEKGKPRAMLDVAKDGPILSLSDKNGKVRAELRAKKDGPELVLADENGKEKANLYVWRAGGPVLLFCDEEGMDRAELSADKKGATLLLCDENAEIRAWLSSDKDRPVLDAVRHGPGLFLFDQKRNLIWAAP